MSLISAGINREEASGTTFWIYLLLERINLFLMQSNSRRYAGNLSYWLATKSYRANAVHGKLAVGPSIILESSVTSIFSFIRLLRMTVIGQSCKNEHNLYISFRNWPQWIKKATQLGHIEIGFFSTNLGRSPTFAEKQEKEMWWGLLTPPPRVYRGNSQHSIIL